MNSARQTASAKLLITINERLQFRSLLVLATLGRLSRRRSHLAERIHSKVAARSVGRPNGELDRPAARPPGARAAGASWACIEQTMAPPVAALTLKLASAQSGRPAERAAAANNRCFQSPTRSQRAPDEQRIRRNWRRPS